MTKCPHCYKEIEIAIKQKASVNGKWFCSECNKPIPEHVKQWSETNLGVPLCYDCQAKAKEK